MLRLILDTNIYLSALIYGGMVETILDCIAENKVQMLVSPDLEFEILKKFREKQAPEETVKKVRFLLEYQGVMITPTVTITACRDQKDNFILELAQTVLADYIVTRDKDLLDMKKWKTTKIVKPENLLPVLREMGLVT